MREILFKAKRLDNGEWVEGYYAKRHGVPLIYEIRECPQNNYEVDPKTVCQYTGLTDKKGKKIWENDIVQLDNGAALRVSWHHFKASWVISKKGWMYNHFFGEGVEPENVEVICNIFDNPELIGGQKRYEKENQPAGQEA